MVKCKERRQTRDCHSSQKYIPASPDCQSLNRQQVVSRQQINRLHQQFRDYGANAKLWLRKCQLLLPEIAHRQVWRRKGFSSIYEYAAKLAGMSRQTVDDALWILHKTEDKPHLRAVAEEAGLNRIRPVISVATTNTDQFWAQKARVMSRQALATYIHDYRLELRTGPKTQPVKSTVVMQLDPQVAEQLKQLKGDRDWNELMRELVRLALDRDGRHRENEAGEDSASSQGSAAGSVGAASSSEAMGSGVTVKTPPALEQVKIFQQHEIKSAKSRYIPVRVKRQVLQRTGGLCAYPGCLRPYKILHHTRRFVLEPVHDPDKIVPLCEGHERIAHRGLIEGELRPVSNWRVRKEADPEDPLFDVDFRVMQQRQMAQRRQMVQRRQMAQQRAASTAVR